MPRKLAAEIDTPARRKPPLPIKEINGNSYIQMVRAESKIDIAAFLPPKRRIVRDMVVIALISLVCGPLLGLLLFNAPRGITLRLSLATGLVWGMAFAFVMAFIYTAWLIRLVTMAYHKHVAALKMDDFYRAIGEE